MKTAGKENQNSCATAPSNRAHGAAGQNRSCSMKWAAKVEKFQPRERFFFLTFPFIELTRHLKTIRFVGKRDLWCVDNCALVKRRTYIPFLSCANSAVGTMSSVYPQSKQTRIFCTT